MYFYYFLEVFEAYKNRLSNLKFPLSTSPPLHLSSIFLSSGISIFFWLMIEMIRVYCPNGIAVPSGCQFHLCRFLLICEQQHYQIRKYTSISMFQSNEFHLSIIFWNVQWSKMSRKSRCWKWSLFSFILTSSPAAHHTIRKKYQIILASVRYIYTSSFVKMGQADKTRQQTINA